MRTAFTAEPCRHAWPDGHGDFGQLFAGVAGVALVEPDLSEAAVSEIPSNGTVLELGSWSCSFAAWLCQRRPDIRVTCVDALVGVPDGRVLRGMLSLINLALYDNLSWFKGTTAEFGRFAATGQWDVVIVDADHSERGCAIDLDLAERLTRRAIWAHDYDSPFPGVKVAVDRFVQSRPWKISRRAGSMAFLSRK